MQTTTVLLIILAAVLAMVIVLFQYFYKVKNKGSLRLWLSFLRFLSLFSVFLLLVNPKFTKKDYTLEKSNLILLVDNSSSIKLNTADNSVDSILKIIKASNRLKDKFNIEQYRFGKDLSNSDTISFLDTNTDIAKALKSLNTIFGNRKSAVVLFSDGNSTIGEDYEYYGKNQNFPIYPIVLGDTTTFEDLKITQVNANKYAFLKNKYPIETFVSYEGKANVKANLNVFVDGIKTYSQNLELSANDNSKVITSLLNAGSVGLKTIRISVEPLINEKNIINNQKNISIEVIDEKTNIAIISDMLHPDIGALKKAIESNEQRSVTILKPNVSEKVLDDMDIFILYQPNASFRGIYEYIKKRKVNIFTISGPNTDWNFLNSIQNSFTKNSYGQTEEVTPLVDRGFSIFDISNFEVQNYPPLETNLGEVIINKAHDILLGQKIKGTEINEPLLALVGSDLDREAILFGENLWKWRVQGYREYQNFNSFDEIMGKIILYLSTNESRSRLLVDYKSFYEGNNEVKISATYFDETFSFDPGASINLILKAKGANTTKELPMLLKGNSYEADLGNIASGEYDFTIDVVNENLSKSGRFNILDFDVEKQFSSSNYKKLERLAANTKGKLYYPSSAEELLQDLITEDNFKPIQKSNQNVVSLVDFRFLLGIIIASLTAEWFIRKYNGLI